MSLWTSLHAEWAAMGETGQTVALVGFGFMYAVGAVVGLRYAFRGAIPHPDEVTDSDHCPTCLDWDEEKEARIRAEKEQAG